MALTFGPTAFSSAGGAPATSATMVTQFVSAITGFAPPANALAFLLQASDVNASNMRWSVAAAASTLFGHQLQAGRDTGLVPWAGPTLSFFPEAGTGTTLQIQLTWFIT